MLKMTKISAMGGLLEPIKISAIRKSVLNEAVLLGAEVYMDYVEKIYQSFNFLLYKIKIQFFQYFMECLKKKCHSLSYNLKGFIIKFF